MWSLTEPTEVLFVQSRLFSHREMLWTYFCRSELNWTIIETDYLIDWLIDWLDWLTDRSIKWRMNWLVSWLVDWWQRRATMGCVHTTRTKPESSSPRAKADISHLWVTARQRHLIRTTWPRLVACDSDFEQVGVAVFLRIFHVTRDNCSPL